MLSFSSLRRPLFVAALFAADLVVLTGGLVVGCGSQGGEWAIGSGLSGTEVGLVMVVYVGALAAGGAYRLPLRSMHLPAFLRMALALCGAWATAVAGVYLLSPADMPARGVMVIHGLAALVGILGLRAVLRQGLEQRHDASSPTSSSPPAFELQDLVDRNPVQIDRAALTDYLSDRTVLVTGAGGSVGSELSRQLVDLAPFRLGLVDVSEHNLYELEHTLRRASFEGDLQICVGDVRDDDVMNRLFTTLQPDIVLHTAAYKQVPLMERHPAEAFRNNTMATVQLLDLCDAHGVDQFVFVSTDKAIEPTSVLGATKRLAEWYVRAAASDVTRKIVRFGNVFGSQGSVVPLFEKQLAAGQPLTVTHPAMERYFMSVDEACGLILQTLLLDAAPVYCFRMGDPIRIDDLARAMIRRWDPSADPETRIEYVGRRPGEKLSERLVMPNETPRPTSHDSIVGLDGSVPYSRAELVAYFRRLQSMARSSDSSSSSLRTALHASAPPSVLE